MSSLVKLYKVYPLCEAVEFLKEEIMELNLISTKCAEVGNIKSQLYFEIT
jgi:hypothetical protein